MSDAQNGSNEMQRMTLVEEGTSFQGSFSSQCPIVVKGRIEGNISGPSLTVSATGAVAGTVKVGVIESEGELSGEFEADVVRLSGRVRDNTVIRARSLEVKLSPENGMMQVIFGECALDVGDMPSKDEALAAAMGPAETAPAMDAPAAEPEMTAPMIEASPERALDAPEMMAPPADESPAPISAAEMPVAMEPPAVPSPERTERKNGGKGRSPSVRTSTMPPPAH